MPIRVRGVLDGLLERLLRPRLSRLGLAQLTQHDEGIRDFPKRREHPLLVLELRLSLSNSGMLACAAPRAPTRIVEVDNDNTRAALR
jgi:hypothetical protein